LKASSIRKIAEKYTLEELANAAEVISEEERDPLGVDGEDLGEKLTHVMLAMRIREKVEQGQDLRSAFREQLGEVRSLLENE
jgi:hypothetical protein